MVESRFYRPELWREIDPVVTNGGELLRFEGFSSCAGVYARADLTAERFTSGRFGPPGTTNVDLNAAFVRNLARLRPGKEAAFEVGHDSVRLKTHRAETVEHKVRLPERAVPLVEMGATTARRLLHAVPGSCPEALFLVPSAHRPQVLHRRPAGDRTAIEVRVAHRLRLLDPVLASV